MTDEKPIQNRSIILVVARRDSATMFQSISPGANAAIIGVIALIAVANQLHKVRQQIQDKTSGKNVIFIWMDGEAFDYIGSYQLVSDLLQSKFLTIRTENKNRIQMPEIQFHHISHIIELNQLTLQDALPKVFAHSDVMSNEVTKLENERISKIFSENFRSRYLNFSIVNDLLLPPSSIQTFLKYDRYISAVVLTNFHEKLRSKFYHSIFDNFKNPLDPKNYIYLNNLAIAISKSLYFLLTNETFPENTFGEMTAMVSKMKTF